jgi:serine protease Do
MKFHRITRCVFAGFGLAFSGGLLLAREPVRDLAALAKLESKVEAVSSKVMPATVALLSEKTGSSGSGVITTADGLVLTAAHVVQGAEELTVVFPDGEQVAGKVLGANYSKDIAMVQISAKGPWPFAEMGASKPLEAGDWVVALGHSAGFDAARTPPVRFGRVVSKGPGNFLTTDCTLIGGDSGGPLFDLDGKIVGINSSIGVSLTNNNHAGIDGFKEDWDKIRAGEAWGRLSMNPFANPEMPVLGIGMGIRRGVDGVPVESVVPKSPSAAAGVRAGDVIRMLDGNVIHDANKLLQVLAKRQPGDKVKLGVLRDLKSLEVEVLLARREALFEE